MYCTIEFIGAAHRPTPCHVCVHHEVLPQRGDARGGGLQSQSLHPLLIARSICLLNQVVRPVLMAMRNPFVPDFDFLQKIVIGQQSSRGN